MIDKLDGDTGIRFVGTEQIDSIHRTIGTTRQHELVKGFLAHRHVKEHRAVIFIHNLKRDIIALDSGNAKTVCCPLTRQANGGRVVGTNVTHRAMQLIAFALARAA